MSSSISSCTSCKDELRRDCISCSAPAIMEVENELRRDFDATTKLHLRLGSFYVGLHLPVFSRVPFLVSDLACLVRTVQIKIVSTAASRFL